MKTIRRSLPVIVLMLACIPLSAQNAEEKKIIAVIEDELDAFLKKDAARWASHWVHTDYAKVVSSGAFFYSVMQGWDSVRSSLDSYFASTEGRQDDIKKGDYKIRINGNTAVVDLVQTATGEPFGSMTSDHTIILERSGDSWKFAEMLMFDKWTQEATDFSIEMNLNALGYRLLNAKKNKEALQVFELNTKLFPNAFNTWDSLAEAYLIMGNNKKAIQYYEKSLALNAKNDNAKQHLAKLKSVK